jgi:tetratricopeptide (TPR) repeat protein
MAAVNAGVALSIDAENRSALEQAVTVLRRVGAKVQQKGDRWSYAQVCKVLALPLGLLGNDAEALMLLDQAQAIYEDLEDWQSVAILTFQRSEFALGHGRPDLALQAWESAVAMSEERGDRVMENLMLGQYSINAVRYGRIDHALRLRERSLQLTRELSLTTNEPWNLWELGEAYRVAGAPAEARRYFEEARVLFRSQGNRMGLAYHRRGLGDLAHLTGDSIAAADHFTAAIDYLRDFPDEIWCQVYMVNGLARALIDLAQPSEALEQVRSALTMLRRYRLVVLVSPLLATVAELALACGRAEPAAALCAMLSAHPITWNEIRARSAALAVRARAALDDEAAHTAEAIGRSLEPTLLAFGLAGIPAEEPQEWLDQTIRLIGIYPDLSSAWNA